MRLHAEHAQFDGLAHGRNDAVLTDDAILFAAGDDLSGQQDQRPLGVVHQDQPIDLRALYGRRLKTRVFRPDTRVLRVRPRPHEAADLALFGDDHPAGTETLVQRQELRCIMRIGGDHRKHGEVILSDGREHAPLRASRFVLAAHYG